MCRLLMVTKLIDGKTARRVIDETAAKFKDTQRDGFGFAAFNRRGEQVAYGRYYPTYKGWGTTEGALEEGSLDGDEIQTLIVHGRTSTNVLGTEYCHPYERNKVYVAHNGILSWRGEGPAPTHPNDSGAFLEWLEQNDNPVPSVWKDSWSGYGALAIMIPGHGLQVTKCNSAHLSMVAARKSGYILTTRATDFPTWLVEAGARPVVLDSRDLRFDTNGELASVRPFSGFARRVFDAAAYRSLYERNFPATSRAGVDDEYEEEFDDTVDEEFYDEEADSYEEYEEMVGCGVCGGCYSKTINKCPDCGASKSRVTTSTYR